MSKVSSAEDKSGDEMDIQETESLKLHKRTAVLSGFFSSYPTSNNPFYRKEEKTM